MCVVDQDGGEIFRCHVIQDGRVAVVAAVVQGVWEKEPMRLEAKL